MFSLLATLVFWLSLTLSAVALTVTPQDYGAVADDGQDDTLAVKQAIAALNSAGGGTLFVPVGVYELHIQYASKPGLVLQLGSNIAVIGESHAAILRNHPDVQNQASWRMIGFQDQSAAVYENVSIVGLTLDGNFIVPPGGSTLQQQQNHAVSFYSALGKVRNVRVENCILKNLGGDGVQLSANTEGVTVAGNKIEGFGRAGIGQGGHGARAGFWIVGNAAVPSLNAPNARGIDLEPASGPVSDVFVSKNIFNEIQTHTIRQLSITDNIIRGPVFVGGIGSANLSVINNYIDNDQASAAVQIIQEIRGARIVNNTIVQQTNFAALSLTPSLNRGSNLMVKNNLVTYAGVEAPGVGINVSHMDGLRLTDNTILGFAYGITVSGSSKVAIRGNTALGTQSGMQVSGTPSLPSHDWEISGNEVSGNPWAIRLIESGGGNFTGVLLKNNLRRDGDIVTEGAPTFVEWD